MGSELLGFKLAAEVYMSHSHMGSHNSLKVLYVEGFRALQV